MRKKMLNNIKQSDTESLDVYLQVAKNEMQLTINNFISELEMAGTNPKKLLALIKNDLWSVDTALQLVISRLDAEEWRNGSSRNT